MIMNLSRMYFSIAALLLLSGCTAGMNDDFSCNAIDGETRCVSMTDINTAVDDGQYRTDHKGNIIVEANRAAATVISTTLPLSPPITLIPPQATVIDAPTVAFTTQGTPSGQPTRQREEVREITVFPYIDTEGNYHATSVIYTVLQHSQWQPFPMAIQPQQ
ncbi:type IV conjugative transfer system lipoprotein TraV [Photobacterium carnosum]|nr:type IV conjugative transfer system lipoprotein TraV [Photobacterium carnosum]